ncbi:MAG: Uma2 family endonuclease [Gemmatimonadota bacterium]|nr:Uma2 family endonuclease [Gemmatimonadota bacterium]
MSSFTPLRDRGIKLRLYERQGVAEYWIVDPEAEVVEVWRFEGGRAVERYADRLPVRLGREPAGEISLVEIFAAG